MKKPQIYLLGRRIYLKDLIHFMGVMFILGMMQFYHTRYQSVRQNTVRVTAEYAFLR